MPARQTTERLLATLRQRGVTNASELATALGTSQPSVSRALAEAGERVVRIGRARRTRYAAVRDTRGLGSDWPLFRIDEHGRAHGFGKLTALHGGGCLVTAESAPSWLRGDFADGLFPGLPWFLDDLRPQGFLGRQFAHRFARELGLSDDLQRWDEDAVLAALLLHGDDGPGDFVLGERSLQRALGHVPDPIPAALRSRRYARMAEAALAGAHVGSSAAGEQPKFTACVASADHGCRHVIVKFSPPVSGDRAAGRWADLLACEHLAAGWLAAHGDPGAATELIRSHDRWCLEATRFDRVGAHGRRGVVTLAAWSDAHRGQRDDWSAAATSMHRSGWIDRSTFDQVCLRWWFGRLIGNTDMHFGNLTFYLGEQRSLTLAPGYDMLPMRYQPAAGGVLYQQPLVPPPPLPSGQETWSIAAGLAQGYWEQLAGLNQLSADFRHLAGANAAAIAKSRGRFG